jgi:hypothetical protein
MSFDYQVVVRGRRRKPATVRKVVLGVLARHPGAELVTHDEDAEPDDDQGSLELHLALSEDSGGTIEVTLLRRGYQLAVDSSRDGNRESWEAICGVLVEIANELGEIVEDAELAAQMIEETVPERAAEHELASTVVLALHDPDGAVIQEDRIGTYWFAPHVLPGGMLANRSGTHPLLTEEGRFVAKGARLTATLHDEHGRACVRHTWTLDGYGRITGVSTDRLA